MIILLFVIHVLIALALVGVVMLQKSEGGALGMGGGGMSGFMTGRSTANLLTRTTAILAALFFGTSILLAGTSVFYQLALIGQVGFYLLAGYGAVIELNSRPQSGSSRHRVAERPATREVA